MRYLALATDYDGTLASDGAVEHRTIEALRRLRESGRRLILVTGRIIEQLVQVFPQLDLCDMVVADNGAVLYDPKNGHKQLLADPPPRTFIEELARRGVPRIEIGDVIVATWEPHETTVLKTIHDMSLELQIIFNKGAVMILPTGVNKATGLRTALARLGISPRQTVGVGDAENDEAFLRFCDVSVAVDNALDVVKKQVCLVTRGARGAGVTELIERMLENDLAGVKCEQAYLDGDLSPGERFYFRGPSGKLNLGAQNLRLFMQMGDGVDDETWQFHLSQGDYARWFREVIGDAELAEHTEALRNDGALSVSECRTRLFQFIEGKYKAHA